jgi:hypothetical protein
MTSVLAATAILAAAGPHAAMPTAPPDVAWNIEGSRKGVTYWPKLDNRDYSDWLLALRGRGYDHVGLVFGPHRWQEGKGGPVAELDRVRFRIQEALDTGMNVIVRTQPWALKYTEMFQRDDVRYFDVWLAPFARIIGEFDPRRVAWEFISEPGWFTRETSKLGLGNNDAQRPVGTAFLHKAWEHMVPLIRRDAPRHTLFLGLPGWGHSYGAQEHLLVRTGRFENVIHYFHFYWPIEFTHDKALQLDWPEPNWRQKLRGKDLNTVDYAADRKTWDRRGLSEQLERIARWRDEKNIHVFITEAGPVYNRHTPAGKAYRRELEREMAERRLPYSIWLD